MSATNPHLSWYAAEIKRITGCPNREAELIEEIMRRYVLRARTLDGVRPGEFRDGALEALAILNDFRNAGDMPEPWRRFRAGEQVVL